MKISFALLFNKLLFTETDCIIYYVHEIICSDGLMDMTAVSGAADTGSIPVRSTRKPYDPNL